ncbi:MAG: class I SAM-dependent rRNA methyltransferase [Deltaproteobacteria bacterium]|nr:class I SAM-dependent rRNA methyltransferase [Deltaproteobacteria bacterium]
MSYPRIILKKDRETPLRHGHPWVFSGALARVEGNPVPGDVVLAADSAGRPLGLGFFNTGDIAFRLLTDDPAARVDADFWRRRIERAVALRRKVVPPETNAFRLINAEGDGIPGLVVDRYGGCLVLSIGTAGVERWREILLGLLLEAGGPAGIYERSEGRSRQLEGLSDRIGPAAGEIPAAAEIMENGLSFEVDLITGQKTGFFLDQRGNREIVGLLSREAAVLNCFSYTGAFSVYAARGGALRVVSVEASAAANGIACRNLVRNGFTPERHPVLTANCFEYLRETEELFDLIVLDPPAFAKSRKDVERSARGYKEINLQAARRLREGGMLATFSCSNPIGPELFEKIVLGAVRDAGKTAQLLGPLGAGPDHPVNLAHPEGRYLKGLLLCLTRN